jgi:hypothetical protein
MLVEKEMAKEQRPLLKLSSPEARAVLYTRKTSSREAIYEIIFDAHTGERPRNFKKERIITQRKFEYPSTFSPVLKTKPFPETKFSTYLYDMNASSLVQSKKTS